VVQQSQPARYGASDVRLPFEGELEDGDGTVTGADARVAPHAYLIARPR